MQADLTELEKGLWSVADELRANSGLKSSEFSTPVLGLIFLRFAEARFDAVQATIDEQRTGRRDPGPEAAHALGVLHVDDAARFSRLVALPEGADLGKATNEAMRLIEEFNPDLDGVLPRDYAKVGSSVIASLVRQINGYTRNIDGDAFGLVYEYFLQQFAASEGQKAGEFFTPMSIVKLIVEILEPYSGRVYDPACGSGGVFVQSADFVRRHREQPGRELTIYGQEKTRDTIGLAKMNLAVHGLSGTIAEANSYYDRPFRDVGGFDFVMANPPFNVDKVDKAKLECDERFPKLPKADNANYLWIQLFANSLSERGRAGFVMANSASDARHSEAEIRQGLIEDGLIDVMIAVGPNFFYTVTLPVTLWFLDRGKADTPRADQVLFIDAREIFQQVDRAHREFSQEQLELLVNIVRLYRGETLELSGERNPLLDEHFPDGAYVDVPALCRVVTVQEIAEQGWSLNPGRYVGTKVEELDDEDFQEKLASARDELRELGTRAAKLEAAVDRVLTELLDD